MTDERVANRSNVLVTTLWVGLLVVSVAVLAYILGAYNYGHFSLPARTTPTPAVDTTRIIEKTVTTTPAPTDEPNNSPIIIEKETQIVVTPTVINEPSPQ